MFKSVLLHIILLALIQCNSGYSFEYKAQLDSFLTECNRQNMFSGTVLIADRDSIIFCKGYGYANEEWQIPNDSTTKYYIGSISKQFTTMMIFRLIETGQIELSDPIIKYLPDYRPDIGSIVTVDHLLRHMSGIPSYTTEHFWKTYSHKKYPRDEFIRRFCQGDLVFEPGSIYRYSNTNTYLLAAILENVTGISYRENLQKRLLRPLKMYNTGVIETDSIRPHEATNYQRRLGRYIHQPLIEHSNIMGTGSLYATVGDLLLWKKAFESDIVLSDSMREIVLEPYDRINKFYGRAYGWNVFTSKPRDCEKPIWLADYNGELFGAYAAVTRVLEDSLFIVLTSNHGRTPVTSDEILNIIYTGKYKLPQYPIDDFLGKIIYESGIDSAVAVYNSINTKYPTFSRQSENILNELGYNLLRSDMVEEALAIFEICTRDHPRAPNAWDSYAEGLAISGDTATAIKYYQKSIQLNPNNDNARVMLEILTGTQDNQE